jgi:hypothetical protein
MARDARRCRAPHHEGLEELILRSIANGLRECAPDDRFRGASRRTKPPDGAAHRHNDLAACEREFYQTSCPLKSEGVGNAGCPLHPQSADHFKIDRRSRWFSEHDPEGMPSNVR